MGERIGKYLRHKEEVQEAFNAPQNKRLKYAAITVITLLCILQLTILVLLVNDSLSERGLLIWKICSGLLALLFIALYLIWAYRSYRLYFQNRFSKLRK